MPEPSTCLTCGAHPGDPCRQPNDTCFVPALPFFGDRRISFSLHTSRMENAEDRVAADLQSIRRDVALARIEHVGLGALEYLEKIQPITEEGVHGVASVKEELREALDEVRACLEKRVRRSSVGTD